MAAALGLADREGLVRVPLMLLSVWVMFPRPRTVTIDLRLPALA